MPFFGTTPFAAPGLGLIASAVMLAFGLWWLARAERLARAAGEGFGGPVSSAADAAHDTVVRERATAAQSFDPAEAGHGQRSVERPGIVIAVLPLAVVMAVNLIMSLLILPRLDTAFLAEAQWGATSLAGVGGVWSVITALAAAIVVLYALNRGRLKSLRDTVDAGLNAAALPAFQVVSDWVLGIEGGPLVGLALSTNVLSALTGSASGGLTIALGALGETYMQMAAAYGIDPALMHRVAVIGAGSLDSLPHNGAVVTLLAVCGATHKQSYFDIVMVGIVSALLALGVVIVLGSAFGSF